MIGELEIGDILEVNKVRLQCHDTRQHDSCDGCYWLVDGRYCDHHKQCGRCSSSLRHDHKDVIFVKVGEVQNA